MVIYILLGIIIVYFFLTYNSLVKLKNRITEAYSTMDVYLKKRWDLIPNIITTIKEYAKYESETLTHIIEKRSSVTNERDKLKIEKDIEDNIHNIIALKEDYPELKANSNYKNLFNELMEIEKCIENARKYYNGTIRVYNDKVEMFPSNLIAKILGFKTKTMFLIKDNEKENVEVEL